MTFSLFRLAIVGILFAAVTTPSSVLLSAPLHDANWRAMEGELEAIGQQARSIKLGQELIEERLHSLESAVDKLKRELTNLELRQVAGSSSSLSPQAQSPINLEALKKWQQQTDNNIKHLQEALQTLASVMGNTSGSLKETGDGSVYVVKSGDSLEKIAKKHSVSMEAIKELNQLKSSKIQIGQKLKLPAPKS